MILLDYRVNLNLDKHDIGSTYLRYKKECIFDIVRKILVIKNPEEIIRQKVIRYLIKDLGVPKWCIEVEFPMSFFRQGAKGRADIIVQVIDNDGKYKPVMIIECKAPNIILTDKTWSQVISYNSTTGAEIAV